MVIDVYSIQGVRGASIPVEVVADLKPIDLGRSVVECTAPVVFKGAVTNAGDCMVVDGRITSKAKAPVTYVFQTSRCVLIYRSLNLTVRTITGHQRSFSTRRITSKMTKTKWSYTQETRSTSFQM